MYVKITVPNNILICSYKAFGKTFTFACDNDNKTSKQKIKNKAANQDVRYMVCNNTTPSFFLQIKNAAMDKSSSKGKLSTWECEITQNQNISPFSVQINAESLCELFCHNTFVNGLCQNKVMLGFLNNGQIIALTKNMPLYTEYVKNFLAKENVKTEGITNYEPGDKILTVSKPNEEMFYIGPLYEYFSQTVSEIKDIFYVSVVLYRKPKVKYVFAIKKNNSFTCYLYTTKQKRVCIKNEHLSQYEVKNILSNFKLKDYNTKRYTNENFSKEEQIFNILNQIRYDVKGDQEYSEVELNTLIGDKIEYAKQILSESNIVFYSHYDTIKWD